MKISVKSLNTQSIYERLQELGFEYEEIEEAIKSLLFEREREFLNKLYPLGLDVPNTIFEFAILNDPLPESHDIGYWQAAQKILGAYADDLANYYLDALGDVQSVNGSPVLEEKLEKLRLLLHLNKFYKNYEKYYHHFSSTFDYVRVETIMRNYMRRIIGEKPLSFLPRSSIYFEPEREQAAKDLSVILSIMEAIMKDCRKGKEISRLDVKSNIRYLKEYNPTPFQIAAPKAHQHEIAKRKIKDSLKKNRAFSISSEDLALFREILSDSPFMTFLRSESQYFQSDEGVNPYTLIRVWINPESITRLTNLTGIHMDTMGGYLKECFSMALDKYCEVNIQRVAKLYTPHRPETLRYLASKVPDFPYSTEGCPLNTPKISDQLCVLLNVIKPRVFAQLPKVEQNFIILRYGLRGKSYSCETIAKVLHADLNLIRNYYAKYLRLTVEAMKQYAHQYVDMEAEQEVVLK